MDLLFAPFSSSDGVAYLARLISEHHHEFSKLYPSHSIIPKMHFMIQYFQEAISESGKLNKLALGSINAIHGKPPTTLLIH